MKLTKRILAIFLAMAMMFALTACGDDTNDNTDDDNEATVAANEEGDATEAPDEQEDNEDEYVLGDFTEETFIDFAVMAFNHREFTIPADMDIKVGGNLGPRPELGGEGGGASDGIRIIGFQGYAEPKDENGEPMGYEDGTDSTWQVLISQNGEFWSNVDRIEAEFYLEGESDPEDISNVETFIQGGALWNHDWWNSGENLIAQFGEDNGGDGFHWGNRMTAVWNIPQFVDDRVENGGRERDVFEQPPTLVDPEDESSDKKGGGVSKFGLMVKTDSPVNDVNARIVWTSVKIYVYDMEIFQNFVDEVTEVTGVEMSDGAIDNVIVVDRP